MSRSWPYLTAVAVVGVLAGAAIGGKPVAQDPFVLAPEQIPTTTIATSDGATGAPNPVTSTTIGIPSSVTTTTVSTSTGASSTDSTTAATAAAGARLVIADATGTATALATAEGKLTTAGYTQVVTTAVAIAEASSAVYYRAGFVAQAAAVSDLLGIGQAPLVPLTDQVVTASDDQGDIVVLLGSDVAS